MGTGIFRLLYCQAGILSLGLMREISDIVEWSPFPGTECSLRSARKRGLRRSCALKQSSVGYGGPWKSIFWLLSCLDGDRHHIATQRKKKESAIDPEGAKTALVLGAVLHSADAGYCVRNFATA